MEDYQIKANEVFFLQMIAVLSEGGKWVWKEHLKIFTKTDGKLVSDDDSYQLVAGIVSPEFLAENFVKE